MYVSSKEDILFLVAQDLMNDISVKLSETILDPDSPVRSLEIGFCQLLPDRQPPSPAGAALVSRGRLPACRPALERAGDRIRSS
jgi:hypothetical protein